MKHELKSAAATSMVAALVWLTAGCGDSKKRETPVPQAQPAPPTAAGAADELKKAATGAAKEVATEVRQQATDVAAMAKNEAVSAYQKVSSQLASGFQSSSDPLLKEINADLGSRVSKLGESLKNNEAVKAQVASAMESLRGKKDAEAVGTLNRVNQSQLTPEQTALAKEVYNATAALVTQRNFSNLEGMNSEVSQLVTSVWKGNYTAAVAPLQKIWSQAKLTDEQKSLLGSTFDPYVPASWRTGAATVQKGLDTLKGLSK